MLKEKEYPINSYGPVRTNKDRTCVCCGDTVPAGSSRMMPRNAKSSYCLCISCFKKWKSVGGDLKQIMKGNCDIVKGHKLYIALKKAINEKKVAVIRFDTDQPICISTRIMNPSFGVIMDEYGKDIFQGNLKLINVPKGVKDLIVNYIEKYRKL